MAAAVPVIRVIGPGRNIGKTWLASRLISAFAARGYEVGAVKRSHHPVPEDREGSDTQLFAAAGAHSVVFGAGDATLTRSARVDELAPLVATFAGNADLVVVEGFKSDTLGAVAMIEPGQPTVVHLLTMDQRAIGTFRITDVDDIASAFECALALSADGDAATRAAIRGAAAQHGHRCPGITLGARMALQALDVLGVAGDAHALREMTIEVETARCATDAIVAVTGCTPGSGRLSIRERGKVAATFTLGGRAVRVAVRPGVDALPVCCDDRMHAQDRAYRTLDVDALLQWSEREAPAITSTPVRGRRVTCAGCGEEVTSAYTVPAGADALCLDCAARETQRTETPRSSAAALLAG
ncbi:MAG: molybdopterin-guanine dinucleotide biosynthesis protein MobB [Dehalococcoidia bacterium]